MTDKIILDCLEISQKIYNYAVEILNEVLAKKSLSENKNKCIDELWEKTLAEFNF